MKQKWIFTHFLLNRKDIKTGTIIIIVIITRNRYNKKDVIWEKIQLIQMISDTNETAI